MVRHLRQQRKLRLIRRKLTVQALKQRSQPRRKLFLWECDIDRNLVVKAGDVPVADALLPAGELLSNSGIGPDVAVAQPTDEVAQGVANLDVCKHVGRDQLVLCDEPLDTRIARIQEANPDIFVPLADHRRRKDMVLKLLRRGLQRLEHKASREHAEWLLSSGVWKNLHSRFAHHFKKENWPELEAMLDRLERTQKFVVQLLATPGNFHETMELRRSRREDLITLYRKANDGRSLLTALRRERLVVPTDHLLPSDDFGSESTFNKCLYYADDSVKADFLWAALRARNLVDLIADALETTAVVDRCDLRYQDGTFYWRDPDVPNIDSTLFSLASRTEWKPLKKKGPLKLADMPGAGSLTDCGLSQTVASDNSNRMRLLREASDHYGQSPVGNLIDCNSRKTGHNAPFSLRTLAKGRLENTGKQDYGHLDYADRHVCDTFSDEEVKTEEAEPDDLPFNIN